MRLTIDVKNKEIILLGDFSSSDLIILLSSLEESFEEEFLVRMGQSFCQL